MFQTHGFPPELFETLAAERNLAFDWKGFREEMEQHGIESGGGQKIELFRHDPLEALKKALHGSRFLGYETLEVARRQGDRHHRQRSTVRPHRRGRPRAPDRGGARQDAFLRRDGRPSGRYGRDRRARLPLRGDRYAGRRRRSRSTAGICARAGSNWAPRPPPGSTPSAARASAAPIRPPICSTTPCKNISASTPCSKARRSTTIGCGSTSPTRRPSAPRS